MGFLDKIMGRSGDAKEKLADAVDQHGEKLGDALDKAGDFVDDKTGGKFDQHTDTAADKARDALDSLDGQDDDIR